MKRALQIFAGPRVLQQLRDGRLKPEDVRAIPGAAGGPKGLVLNPLDQFIFGHWLASSNQTVHLLGSSIGAWRLACACLPDAKAALAELAEDYVTQRYDHAPGKAPSAQEVSQTFSRKLDERLGQRALQVLSHPTRRLHVFTSHGRRLLARQGKVTTPLGYLAAYLSNAVSRRAMGALLERVVFGDMRDRLPIALNDFRTLHLPLSQQNLLAALLASCSIPFWLNAVHDIPGGPTGAYWDGGITDYHLHLNYASMTQGLVLYPHFQSQIVPGWLDKSWKRRHRASPALDNLVVLAPDPDWIRTLPNAKLPDRNDFKFYGDDDAARSHAWRKALAESGRLADDFEAFLSGGAGFDVRPLTGATVT